MRIVYLLLLQLVLFPWALYAQDLRLGQLIGHKGEISQLSFTPDGKYLFSAGRAENKIFMWDVGTGKLISSSPETAINDMVVSPTGEYVTTSNYLGYLWDVKENTAKVVSDDFHIAYFTREGTYLIHARYNRPYTIQDGEAYALESEFNRWSEVDKYFEYKDLVYGLLKDGSYWNIKSNQQTSGDTINDLEKLYEQTKDIEQISALEGVHAYNKMKDIYAVAKENGSIEILDASTKKLLRVCKGHVNTWIIGHFDSSDIVVSSSTFKLNWNLQDNSFQKETLPTRLSTENTNARPSEEDWYDAVAFDSENKAFTVTALPWWRDEASQREYTFINNKTGLSKTLDLDKWLLQLGVSNDGKYLIAVTKEYDIFLYDIDAEEIIGEYGGHQGTSFSSIHFTGDGNYVFTIGNDGSMILIDLIKKEKKFTFFIINENQWLITTPSGLFDASSQTMNLMYYVKGFEVIEFDQLKERYYEPGLYQKIISGQTVRDAQVLNTLALYPIIEADLTGPVLNVKLTERSGGIGKLNLFINGKEVEEDINPERSKNVRLNIETYSRYFSAAGSNSISIRAWNREGWLKSPALELEYVSRSGGAIELGGFNPKPALYGLVIGTSDYSGDDLDLKYADKDAEYFFKAIAQSGAALFGTEKINLTLLTTKAGDAATLSTKENIKSAFEQLLGIGANDVLIIYFSGHGISYKDQFYYLTKDIASSEAIDDPTMRANYTISSEELTNWITSIPAQKQVLILDACSSGNFINSLGQTRDVNSDQIRALDRMKDRTGMYVLSGSASDKVSYEASQYGQGILTYTILSGMKGRALRNSEFVDVSTLFQFAVDEVPLLAQDIGGIQKPALFYPANASSFDIGIVNDAVEIPLEEVKPVFELTHFEEEESWDDPLKIGKMINDHLDELANADARELVFIPARDIKNAYRIIGKYTMTENEIRVQCRVNKSGQFLGGFTLVEQRFALDKLKTEIVDQSFKIVEKDLSQ